MAQPQEEQMASSFFPDPPPFYKHFTSENQDRLKQLKEDAGVGKDDGTLSPRLSASRLLNLPPELRYLVPPEPPAEDEEYRVFGEITKGRGVAEFDNTMQWLRTALEPVDANGAPIPDVPNVLRGWEYEQLYPSPPAPKPGDTQQEWTLDRQKYLKDMVRSILLNFVELLGIVAVNPTSEDKDEKLKDIVTIVANVHALVNEYRPHQARETLIHMMEDQLERKRTEVEGIKRMKEKVEETLREFAKTAPDRNSNAGPEDGVEISAEEKRKESQRHMWHVMDEIMGH